MTHVGTFEASHCDTRAKLKNFTKYVRRHELARFLVQYQLFEKTKHLKGSVVECGVHEGGGVMTWAKLSEICEPYNYHRKIIGFDTFEGFPSVHQSDLAGRVAKVGAFKESYDTYDELTRCVADLEATRLLRHQEKVVLVKGDATRTIPEYLEANQHTLVSLLVLDFDIYEPTATALRNFLPRMPKGAIIAFDELNNRDWPGETRALLEAFDLNKYTLECSVYDMHISWLTL